jgi:hypothetical protein
MNGNQNFQMGFYLQAKNSYNKALLEANNLSNKEKIKVLNLFGEMITNYFLIYENDKNFNIEEINLAEKYLMKAIVLSKESNLPQWTAVGYSNLSNT